MEFLFELSKKINYYNDDDKKKGNWEDFFTADLNLLVILMSRIDLRDTNANFISKKNTLFAAQNNEQSIVAVGDLLLFLQKMYENINVTNQQFEKTSDVADVETIRYLLKGHEDTGKKLYSYYKAFTRFFPEAMNENLEKGLKKVETNITEQSVFFNSDVNGKIRITDSVSILDQLFQDLFARYLRLFTVANEFVKDQGYMERSYLPQMGLFITFLELYGTVRKRINGLVQKHLDYYYQDVLGLAFEELQPDSVHLVATLEDLVPRLLIGTEDLLLAEVAKGELPVYFRPERKQVFSRAKIKSIKTIFISRYRQLSAPSSSHRNVNEVQVFKAEHKINSPSDYMKNRGDSASWAVMGEDQHDVADSERTMQDGELGLAIASPLFYQVEGLRLFHLKMELKSTGSVGLHEYIENYSAARNKMSRETIVYKFFSKAFLLMYTANDGWETIERYSAKILDSDKNTATLILSFELGRSEKAFDCYQEKIHIASLQTKLPVLKLLLNAQVEHYAYSFLRMIQLSSVIINVKVKGSRAFKLQNNVGPLSPTAPFQPFGPQPSIGSFLDIKNSNIFNRYLKNVAVRINWLDLPKEKGGFASYYEGYGRKIENESFKVDLSSLSGGKYKPDVSVRQHFQLFTSDPLTDELVPVTEISNIDFKKIGFHNNPQLSKELLINEPFFREGAVRLELCTPPDAFGHRIFLQLFPDVILNNTKTFKKKLNIPNQPYTPVIKTIELDFESEFSEGLKEGQVKDENFQLFHLYPFGYHKIFPGGEKKNYWMLPRFDSYSNLMIGLTEVEPNSTLSLFFQLEEKSFHHTLHNPDPISWSYMESNNWVQFKSDSLISNSTGNFINSGIVYLQLPSEIPVDNTILPSGLFWIRASSSGRNGLYGRVKALMVNGFKATRVTEKTFDKQLHLLEADKIKGFAKSVKGIQSVFQLFSSFGGAAAETTESYYVRVSERLRHKNRPVQIRDLAQIILKTFPQILIVKVFNNKRENFSIIPGVDLHVVVIPKESEGETFLMEQPRVNLSDLFKIKTFVSSVVSAFLKIEVGNAVYERVKVFCKVRFLENGKSNSIMLRSKFISDLNNYIAPWMYGNRSSIKIGSKLYKAELLIFLKNLPYVKHISAFSVIQFFNEDDLNGDDLNGDDLYAHVNDSAISQMDVIEGSSPASVLIPSPHHIVNIIQEMDNGKPETSGIGNFIVGEEYLVVNDSTEAEKYVTTKNKEEMYKIIISQNI